MYTVLDLLEVTSQYSSQELQNMVAGPVAVLAPNGAKPPTGTVRSVVLSRTLEYFIWTPIMFKSV